MLITNLLTNMVVIQMGLIQTNTPAFQNYEKQQLVADAQSIAVKWHLDSNLVAPNNITEFSAKAGVRGPNVQIVFGGRYRFWTGRGAFLSFADELYCWPDYSGRKFTNSFDPATGKCEPCDLVLQWAVATNLLTMKKAQQIGESALKLSSVPVAKMKLKRPKEKKQIPWALRDGTPVLMPYYSFDWKPNSRSDQGWCKIDVSGIASNVVFFSCGKPAYAEAPSNYLRMLGLSSNTVFVNSVSPNHKGPPYEIFPYPIPLATNQPDLMF